MTITQTETLVLGGGLAGLSAAFALKEQGKSFLLLEKDDTLGGVLQSRQIQGYELDLGANSAALHPGLARLVEGLQLTEQQLFASNASKNRFLLRGGLLHALSPKPAALVRSKYLSFYAKFRLFTERWRRSTAAAGEETVADFVKRRFGQEVAEWLFDPILAGIYAGDIHRLSVKKVLPMLPRWEQEYGSVTQGLIKNGMPARAIIGFKGGFKTLIQALAQALEGHIATGVRIESVEKTAEGYAVTAWVGGDKQLFKASKIISALPAYALADVVPAAWSALKTALAAIEYPQMGVWHVGFNTADIGRPFEGFGFLAAKATQAPFLGAICNTQIFPSKSPDGQTLFTVFFNQNLDNTEQQVLKMGAALRDILAIQTPPTLSEVFVWSKAIPQFNVGFDAISAVIDAFEAENPDFKLTGNWRSGVSVGDVAQHGYTTAQD